MSDFEFLRVPQVAQRLLIGPDAIRRGLREVQLLGYRLPGGDWRIRPEDVDAVLTPTSGRAGDANQR